jgi:hypothetical protein
MNRRARRRLARFGRRVDGSWRDAVAAVAADVDRVRDHDDRIGGVVVAVLAVPRDGGPARWWVSHALHDRLVTSPALLVDDAADALAREATALRAKHAPHYDA